MKKKKNKKFVYWTTKTVQWGRVFDFYFRGYVEKYFKRKRVKYALINVVDTVEYQLEVRASQLRKKCKCGEC